MFYSVASATEEASMRWDNLAENTRGDRGRRALRRGRGDHPHLRHPRVPGHHLPRDPGPLDREPGAGRLPDAVRVDREPVPGLHARLRLLLRPQDPQLSGPRHRARLRLADRGQDQRAGAAAPPARLPPLARRAHRDGHQRRLLPAGRGPLPADARHHRGPARPREPVLDPHQGHADPARPRAAAAGRRGHRRRHLRLRRLHRPRAVAHRRARHPLPRAPPRRRAHPERDTASTAAS